MESGTRLDDNVDVAGGDEFGCGAEVVAAGVVSALVDAWVAGSSRGNAELRASAVWADTIASDAGVPGGAGAELSVLDRGADCVGCSGGFVCAAGVGSVCAGVCCESSWAVRVWVCGDEFPVGGGVVAAG
ncbi:MAG: hypothetical protein ACRD0P_28860 [Stackebrandtia sp.]